MVSCRANRASSNGKSGHALRCVRTVPSRLTTHPSLPAKQAVWHFSLQQVWAHACTRTAKKNLVSTWPRARMAISVLDFARNHCSEPIVLLPPAGRPRRIRLTTLLWKDSHFVWKFARRSQPLALKDVRPCSGGEGSGAHPPLALDYFCYFSSPRVDRPLRCSPLMPLVRYEPSLKVNQKLLSRLLGALARGSCTHTLSSSQRTKLREDS